MVCKGARAHTHTLIHLIFPAALWGKYYYLYVEDEDDENKLLIKITLLTSGKAGIWSPVPESTFKPLH